MSNKSVNDFVKELVNSDQELPVFPTSWDKTPEQYVSEDEQDQGESEKE